MFRIVSIIEGHGEVQALPILIQRTLSHIDPTFEYEIIRPPLRLPRGKIDKDDEFKRMVELASRKTQGCGAVIILYDADDDCPATKGPLILEKAQQYRPDIVFKAILANKEFESWFVAAASSLAGQKGLSPDMHTPENPESIRDAKGWLRSYLPPDKAYSSTLDQPAFTALFNMAEAEQNSDSFAKFMRDMRTLINARKNDNAC